MKSSSRNKNILKIFVDADYGVDMNLRRSTSWFLMMIGIKLDNKVLSFGGIEPFKLLLSIHLFKITKKNI